MILYLLIILCAYLLYLSHKRTIKKYNKKIELREQLIEQTESLSGKIELMITSRGDIPEPLDKKLVSILTGTLLAFLVATCTILALKPDGEPLILMFGILLMFFDALFLSQQYAKVARREGYEDGYEHGYNYAKSALKDEDENK